MTDSWVIAPATLAAADDSWHSGLTTVTRGNLERAQSQSGYDHQGFHHSTYVCTHSFSTTGDWEGIDEWSAWRIPMRRKDDGTWRDIQLSLEGKCGSTGAVTVRAYLLGWPDDSLDPHSTGGIVGEEAYDEVAFSTTSYVYSTCTITPVDGSIGFRGPDVAPSGAPTHGVAQCALQLIAKSTTIIDLTIRAPRFREVTT